MRSARPHKLIISLFVWGLLTGCAARIPASLATQVSWNLGFPEIRRQPETYVGRIVALGGTVMHIDAVDKGYRVLVSELPLDGSSRRRPAVNQPPRGMFIVLIPRHRLPQDLRPGAEITVVGEILGKGVAAVTEGDEEVPLLDERHTHVWGSSWWPRIQIGIWGGVSI